jgi:nucleotide-binding universal stress UspA family protein
MTAAAADGAPRRVIVALGGAEPASALLRAAGDLLRGTQAELAGLFVEDRELLRLAALPFTREIGLASGTVRPLDVPDVERAFKRQAEQVRRLLVQTAAALELPWSFQVARGSLLDEVLAAALLADLTIVGERQPAGERSTGSTRPTQGESQVLALFDATEGAFRALAAALQLAHGHGERVSLLIPRELGTSAERLRRLAAERLHVAPQLPEVETLPTMRRRRRRALVLPRGEPRARRDEIQALLQTAECPVVLVR